MEFQVDVDIDEALEGLEDKEEKISAAITKTLQDTAYEIMRNAQSDAPVDTGALRASIGILSQDSNSVTVGSDLGYSGFVNDGTYKMAGRPYLSQNVELAAEEFPDRFIDNMG